MNPPGGTLQWAAAVAGAAVMAVGIVVFDWPTFTVLALYWLENVIIGAFTVLRILAFGARSERYLESLGTAAFFTLHYGMFCLVHGVFVATLFGGIPMRASLADPVLLMIGRVGADRLGLLVIVATVIAVALDSWRAWAASDISDPSGIRKIMGEPYGRIVVLHVVLIAGGFIVIALQLPSLAALLLVAFKLIYDLRILRRSRAPALEGLSAGSRPRHPAGG